MLFISYFVWIFICFVDLIFRFISSPLTIVLFKICHIDFKFTDIFDDVFVMIRESTNVLMEYFYGVC